MAILGGMKKLVTLKHNKIRKLIKNMKILLTKQLPSKNADLEYGNVYRQSVKAKMNKKILETTRNDIFPLCGIKTSELNSNKTLL